MLSTHGNDEVTISNKPNILNWYIRAIFFEHTLQKLPKANDILDLCCGYGFYFLINRHATGIDGDFTCSKFISRKMNKQIPVANINSVLPFRDESFSFVISHDVFEHFELNQLEPIMREVHRILKPGGKIVIFVPNTKGFDYGVKINIGHKTFITGEIINNLSRELFCMIRNYSEPFPRLFGKYFTHNKEVYILEKKNINTGNPLNSEHLTIST